MIGNRIFTAMPDPQAGLIFSQCRTGNMLQLMLHGGKMDYQKDTSLNAKTLSDQAQGSSPEGISHPAGQGSLSEDSPCKNGQGSLSGDSPYRTGQGSLSKDSPYGSGQGSLSGDSPYGSGQGSLSGDSPYSPGLGSLSGDSPREPVRDSVTGDLSQGDDGKKQSGGRTLAVAALAVLVVIALFLVVTIIRRPSIKHYDQISPSSSARKDTASDDTNGNETVEAEESEQEVEAEETEQETEEEAAAEEAEPAEEELSDEAVPADEDPAVQEPDEEQKELEKRFERASQLGPEDALTADDYVFYGGTSKRYSDYSGGIAISCEDPEDKDGGENRTVSARGISLQSTKEDVEKAYGPPAASGQVSDQCKFYYIMHDFEGEYDESLKKTADWHLGFDYYEYYYESGCISFDFDENGGVAAIAIDNNSRMFW